MLSGLFKSLIDGMLNIESNPNSGIAITNEITKKARKLARTINIENMSCEKGFMSRKVVNGISVFLQR
jgi:hypothetical protein